LILFIAVLKAICEAAHLNIPVVIDISQVKTFKVFNSYMAPGHSWPCYGQRNAAGQTRVVIRVTRLVGISGEFMRTVIALPNDCTKFDLEDFDKFSLTQIEGWLYNEWQIPLIRKRLL